MKIGILLTDHVIEELLDKHGDQDSFYFNLLPEIDKNVTLEIFDVVRGEYPDDLHECDGYIITGSKVSAYDDIGWVKELEDFIRLLHKEKVALVGVCFGHQLIAQALNGKVKKVGWTVGTHNYNFIENSNKKFKLPDSLRLIHSHQDQVVQLPDNAVLIASTETVPNAFFLVDNHIMSIQGHPEFTPEYALDVAQTRKDILGKEKFNYAKSTLKKELSDNKEGANVWLSFFRSNF